MPAAATIRPVAAEDVPAVVALIARTLREFGIAFGVGSATDEQVRALPESYASAGGAFWVACDGDGAVVGTAGVFPLGSGDWELRKMYLDPATRGQGLGARLLAEVIAHARARDGRRLVLDTTEQMKQAIAFYEAHGFVRDDAQIRGARCSRGYALALR